MKFLPGDEKSLRKMKFCAYALWGVVLASSLSAQTPSEKRWIHRLMVAPASQIDPTLPNKPFDTWLKSMVAPEEPVYEVNDCGERNGTPNERGNQFPLCVHVTAKASSLRQVDLTFIVGTYVVPRKNKPAPPEKRAKISLFYGEVGPSDPRSMQPTMNVDRLSDLPKLVQGQR